MKLFNLLNKDLSFLNPIVDALNVILPYAVGLLATAGTIYSIVLAVNMAKADTADKRSAAKKRIVGVLITMISVIVLLFLLRYVLANLDRWVNGTTTAANIIALIR